MSELNEVASVVKKYLEQSGRNVAYIDYSTIIQDNLGWYRGKVAFHHYNVFNGENAIECEKATLGMAKTVCEDMASLEINEKCKITLDSEEKQEYVDKVLDDNNFRCEANKLMELTNALGTGAFVSGIDKDGKVKIDYIHGDMIFPLKWENGIVSECAFVKIGGNQKETKYTLIMHLLNEKGEYIIKTVEVNENGSVVMPFEIGKGIEESSGELIYETNSKIPLFQIVKPNIVNNYDKTNPLGMSIFGNAIDILKSIDNIYDSWNNEFVLGKKRIFVKSNLKKVIFDAGEGISNEIDSNDVLFYQIEWTESDKPPIYETNMQLRTTEHIESIDKQLNLLSRKVGLGDGFYSFNNGAVGRTATEIISVNSSLFRNLKKQELEIEKAIKGLVRAILFLGKFDYEDEPITINFDDSIIEDSGKTREQAMAEFNAGLIDQVEYFVLTRNLTREQAIKFVAEMKATDTMKEVSSIMNFDEGGII